MSIDDLIAELEKLKTGKKPLPGSSLVYFQEYIDHYMAPEAGPAIESSQRGGKKSKIAVFYISREDNP
jgi:hypothetical protein